MLKLALQNLLNRKLRSALSLLGMTVAIAGMVGLFSVSQGIERMMSKTFDPISGLIAMQVGSPIPLFSRIPLSWAKEIRELPDVHVVSPELWYRANVIDSKMILSPPRLLFGTDIPTRTRLKNPVYFHTLVDGRLLNENDVGEYHILISREIAEEFHKSVNDTLQINGEQFTIVGIYETGSQILDTAILMDIDLLRKLGSFDADSACCFYIEQKEGVNLNGLAKEVQDLFKGRKLNVWESREQKAIQALRKLAKTIPQLIPDDLHQLLNALPENTASPQSSSSNTMKHAHSNRNRKANSADKFTATEKDRESREKVDLEFPLHVQNASQVASRFEQFSDDLNLLLALITAIGITIAVLSIVNTMLMSVTERITEIGILKANGWSKRDVMKLITFESATLGFVGGVLGCLLGWSATHIINATWPEKMELFASPRLLLFSLVFSTLMGILGGLYPAIWAMRLVPMEAIRRGY